MADNMSAIVVDGAIQKSTASENSLSTAKAKSGSSLDKDAFLQLLVAQMKYQDPLEPTENTEYISQLATFSELEEMQNLSASSSLQRASSLVGNEVMCKVINSSTGGTEYVQGVVDYVVFENNKAFVSIDEALYSIDDVYEVIDPQYSEAYNLGLKFVSALKAFPSIDDLTLEYEAPLRELREAYDGMNAYQKTFIASDAVKILEAYEAKINELKLADEEAAENTADSV